MFGMGISFILVGSLFVYGAKLIVRLIPVKKQYTILWIKAVGLLCAVIGTLVLFQGEFPRHLEFLRIF
ncbi:hypothetical protein [Thermotalea metallivorans]|uniref:Uncharacterized protein n=1 Tax=Thermotalea metallivorans TaxID=520762 RepID=A0A140KZB4_9FIRM|nr:hypothetical protein [Thermotalea metallivorans]KXG73639.1 hypothetical protein AN619_30070 [Thermotalea metallivorans]